MRQLDEKSYLRGVLEIVGFLDEVEGIHRELKAIREATEKAPAKPPPELLISQAEAVRRLGVRREVIASLVKSGKLPSVLVGKREKVRPKDLERLIARGDLNPPRRGRPRKASKAPIWHDEP